MSKHDEPNEYGFAGGATAPQPPAAGRVDEQDRAEEVAVPGDDLLEPASDAVADEQEERRTDRRS
ncbi:hypothetical protein [Micromonospora endolithica]|uniref:Uncharacterized protein n=1 Tax=Micromonospora endolithica TaxID=230091 RepID=A0A3A9YXA1_9ACTN|nr:hypothetical protein [Micromonospora endolithica]RKN40681.1 hypothetical protein D7223_26495 [Micromonospora endolithica]TWJ21774.1 hypothetical protein JD76_01886 [Micromonospora endolithica]